MAVNKESGRLVRMLMPAVLLIVPITLAACAYYKFSHTLLLTILSTVAAVVPFFAQFEKSRPRPRDIMPIVILSALAAVGRIIFAPFPNFKPVTAIVIIAGSCFGPLGGFMTGALSALASNIFFGQGIWTPWQMYAWGLIGWLSGMLRSRDVLRRPVFVYIWGFCAALLYGFVTDSMYIAGYVYPINIRSMAAAYGAGLPFTLTHAIATVVFLLLCYHPWCRKIDRVKEKYGI